MHNLLHRVLTVLVLLASFVAASVPSFASSGDNVGDLFPNIRFKDEAGTEHTLADYRGKVVLIKFWGSWCGTCRQEWPGHQALYNSLRDEEDVVVLTISFAEPLSASKSYTDSMKYTTPLYHGSNLGIIKTVDGASFQPRGTPFNLLIDRDGVVNRKWIGRQPGATTDQIKQVLQG